MSFDYILFDLDGTLTDPSEGIVNSVIYALKKHGIEETDREKLCSFIGPPLIDAYMEHYGFSKEKAIKTVEFYREYFSVKGIFENRVYKGIPELLEKLYQSGKKIILATSKPDLFANKILEYFGISKFFYFVAGATMNETRTQKQEVIKYALEECNITDTANAVMIGDRKYDISGGKAFGLKTMGLLYGFGSNEEILNSAPDFTAKTVDELARILFKEEKL